MSKYALKYKLSLDNNNNMGFSKDEIVKSHEENEMVGGTDALFIVSIIKPEDGSYSTCGFSFDGQNENKPISTLDMFKIFSLLASKLSEEAPREWQRYIAKETFDKVCQVISAGSKGIESEDEK